MALSPALLRELGAALGPGGLLTDPEDLLAHSYDLFARGTPEAVALPTTADEVARVLGLAHREGIPVTPRGAATSLAGGPVPVRGGICLALTRMNRLLEVNPADRLARAEAGVVTADLQRAAAKCGLFYPPNPTSAAYCTLGGNVATNAGGASGVKYGVTRDYLLGLTAVAAEGEVFRTGGRCLKDVAGYDLTRLLCGSEGRLAVVTEVTVRLLPRPEAVRTVLALYPDVAAAVAAVVRVLGEGLVPSTLELMDGNFLRTVDELFGFGFPAGAGAALLLEVDGPEATIDAQADRAAAAFGPGAVEVQRARSEADRERLWRARRTGTAALVRRAKFLVTLDFAVPLSAIPAAADAIDAAARRHGLAMVLIGHAGDGNLHPMFLYDPDDPAQAAAFGRAEAELCEAVLALGGTLSGEHGIGLEKARFLPRQLAPFGVELARRIKTAFDPRGILNPGKCEGEAGG
ncbi:MAG: FAD-binding oxidoreductase [Deferrisomatales bacterium]